MVVPELFAGLLPQMYEGATPKDKARVAMLAARRRAGARGNGLRKADSAR